MEVCSLQQRNDEPDPIKMEGLAATVAAATRCGHRSRTACKAGRVSSWAYDGPASRNRQCPRAKA
jgi:hypothetical protein